MPGWKVSRSSLKADEISYDESKGLYVLRSKGRDSILTREENSNAAAGEPSPPPAPCSSLRHRTKSKVDSASHIQGIQ